MTHRDLIEVACPYFDHPECPATLEIERFDGACKCWYCGRGVRAVHDCDEDDCYDYAVSDDGLF